MRKRVHGLLAIITCLSAALVVFAVLVASLLQTSEFRTQLRNWTIATLQRESGGRVELASVAFEWRSFTLHLNGLVVHGTEPGGSQPLLSMPSLQVGLRLTSLFQHGIDVSSVSAERPSIHLIIASDGSE